MIGQWAPESDFSDNQLEAELELLDSFDVPVLYHEALLVYRPERFAMDHVQRRLVELARAGALSEDTLNHWHGLTSSSNALPVIEQLLLAVRSAPVRVPLPLSRICCPVVIDYRSELLFKRQISGVRWVEVVERGGDLPIATGFPPEWSPRLESIEAMVRGLAPKSARSRRPHWRMLDSLGQHEVSDERFVQRPRSLEFGVALAYLIWAEALPVSDIVAATGMIDEDGTIDSVESCQAKSVAVIREAPYATCFFVPRGNAKHCEIARGARRICHREALCLDGARRDS